MLKILKNYASLASALYIAVICLWLTLFMGNFWYTEELVLKQLQKIDPNIEYIISSQPNIIASSLIIVHVKNGRRRAYRLDTSMLGDYMITIDPYIR